jgi:hypothetical protein
VLPSLNVNTKKDVFLEPVCGAKGKAWALAAFLAGVEPSNKKAVTAWLREHGLLDGANRAKAKGRHTAKSARGPCVAIYVYTDASGEPLARKLRFEPGNDGRKKDFAWERRETGKWVSGLGPVVTPLYRLPEIIGEPFVVLTEGEKDADAGAAIGLPTTTSGGTGTWREDHSKALRGKHVVIIADADEPGRKEAQLRAASLHGTAACLKVLEIPGAKDLAEAIERGWTRETLLALFEQTPEWKPVSGADILDSLVEFLLRFISITEFQARAVALWVAHTHAVEVADFTPYLNINSPEKESGKTRLIEAAKILVANPWGTENASAAALVRKIHGGFEAHETITVLFDERDSQAAGDKERAEAIRGILNSGYERGGCYSRCVGEGTGMRVVDFQTFCPKALAGIGRLTGTVASRSIPIRMKRARRGRVARFRRRGKEGRKILAEAAELKARLAAWSKANLGALADAQPEIPGALSDRQADACEPLLVIADLAGGEWPAAARSALIELCVGAQADDSSVGVKLLADIRRVFYPRDDDGKALPELERIASEDLVRSLAAMEDRPWAEWGKAHRPISQPQLALLLGRYEDGRHHAIAPRPMRLHDGRRLRGYERDQFEEAWELYLPSDSPPGASPADSRRDSVTASMNTAQDDNFQSVTPDSCHGSKNAPSPNENAPCHAVTAQDWRDGKGEAPPRILFAEDGEVTV